MTTDLAVWKDMLTRAGIPFTESPYEGPTAVPGVTTILVYADEKITGLPENAHEHRRQVLGYMCFYTEFYFDVTGALINLGAYE